MCARLRGTIRSTRTSASSLTSSQCFVNRVVGVVSLLLFEVRDAAEKKVSCFSVHDVSGRMLVAQAHKRLAHDNLNLRPPRDYLYAWGG
jgi:hypothetical protein